MPIEGAIQKLKRMAPTRWIVTAALSCVFGLISAAAFCIGCSVHEDNRLGQPENFLTFLLAGGAYLSLLLVLLSVAVFLVAVGYLVSNGQNRTGEN